MSERESGRELSEARLRMPGAAFLLSQVGFLSSNLWSQRMAALGLDPRQVLLLRIVAVEEGRSQQALGEELQIPPSRMVALVDGLERDGMLERRAVPGDRRVRALYLTDRGRDVMVEVQRVGAEHESQMCDGLSAQERDQLVELLGRIAARHGLRTGVHPGVSTSISKEARSTESEPPGG